MFLQLKKEILKSFLIAWIQKDLNIHVQICRIISVNTKEDPVDDI